MIRKRSGLIGTLMRDVLEMGMNDIGKWEIRDMRISK